MREKSTDRETSLRAFLPTQFSTLFGSEHVPLRYTLSVRKEIDIKRIVSNKKFQVVEFTFMTLVLITQIDDVF